MKKSLLSLALGVVALLSASFSASADVVAEGFTFKQIAKHTAGLPAVNESRQAVVANGVINLFDKSNKNVIRWNEDGKVDNFAITSGGNVAITADGAGHLITTDKGWAGSASPTKVYVHSATGELLKTIALPNTFSSIGRMDFLGKVHGDILNGKAYMFLPIGKTMNMVMFIFEDGVCTSAKDVDLASLPDKYKPTTDNGTVAFVADESNGNLEVVLYQRSNPIKACLLDGNNGFAPKSEKSVIVPDKYNMNGCDVFTLNGKKYIVYPNSKSKAYRDGFSIAPYTTTNWGNTAIVQHVETLGANPNVHQTNWVAAHVVDNYTVKIFQYVPGAMVAVYELSVPKPEMYIVATSGAFGVWDLANPAGKMTLNEQGVFEVKGFQMWGANGTTDAYFVLSDKLGTSSDDWATINANRYEPTAKDFWVNTNTKMDVVKGHKDFAWKVAQGKYNVYFNKETMKLTLQEELSGVEEIAEAATITVQAGAVVVNAENAMAQVYTVSGQLVNACQVNGEAVIELPAGFYIVKVADTVKKVIVR